MVLLDLFRFRRRAEPQAEVVAVPAIVLSGADFEYKVGSRQFERLSYTFEMELPSVESERVEYLKRSYGGIVEVLEGVYTPQIGFSRFDEGSISSNERNIEVKYKKQGLFDVGLANLTFNTFYRDGLIDHAGGFLFSYGDKQEELLSAHDAILGLKNLKISPKAAQAISQIDLVRKGNDSGTPNFLLL
ncbi:MAG: hypothetical protein WCI72_05470 [archaeon]